MASTRRWYGLGFTAAMLAALLVPVLASAAPAATAQGDRVGAYHAATSVWSLDGGGVFLYGNPGDAPFMGDWDCDGTDTPGLHRPVDTANGPAGKVYLRNSNSTGIADVEYFFGDPGDVAFAGDFNGDGCDSVGLFRPATGQVFLTNLLGSANRGIGAAQVTYDFPAQGHLLTGARAVAADFDGDGIDTVALHLPATATVLGVRSTPMTFGDPGDQLLAGAFGGSADSLGVYRADGFHLSDAPGDLTASAVRSLAAGAGTVGLSWSATASGSPAPRSGGDCSGATIVGTANADVINGTSGADVIDGLGGNDVIGGKDGNDTICGGDGDDILNGDRGNDVVFGDAGVDNVNGGDGDDTLHGGAGADIITGDKDNDTLFGDGGADNMNGGSGNDTMDGGDGDDLMSGSGGNDVLLGRDGADVLNGGPGTDTCDVGPGGASATKCENQRPQAQDQSETVPESGPAITESYDTVDPDGDAVTYAILSGPTPDKGVLIDNGNGTFSYDPAGDFESLGENDSEVVTFTYDATENSTGVKSDVATVTITVTGEDDAPVAVGDTATVAEDSGATSIDVLANDTDVDGGPKSVESVTAPANGTVVNNGSDVSYTPNADYCNDGSPTDDFTYTLNGGSTATVAVTVTCVNDGITAVADSYSTPANVTLVVAAPGLLANDVDPDGDATVVPFTGGGLTLNANGSLTFDPGSKYRFLAAGVNEVKTSTYTATDGVNSSSASVTITIQGVNDAPKADPQTVAGNDDIVITLTGSDPDTGTDLFFSIDSGPTAGTLSAVTQTLAPGNVNSATVTYTPDTPGSPGEKDSFVFKVSDGSLTGTAVVDINPDPEDEEDPPGVEGVTAEDDTVETDENEPVTILLLAASDAVGDLTFSIESGPTGGTLGAVTDIDPGTDPVRTAEVTYTPPADTSGTFTFEFRAAEVGNLSNFDVATVTVEVAAEAPPVVPDPPTLEDLTKKLEENETITFGLDESVQQTGTEDICDQPPFPCGRAAQSDYFEDDLLNPLLRDGGDVSGVPDLDFAKVGVTSAINNVAFEVRYASGFNSTTTRTGIVVDIDGDKNTGFPGVDAANSDSDKIGVEYLINIGANLGANAEIKQWVSGNTFVTVATVPATILSDGHHVQFPLALLGDDDGQFNYKVTVQTQISPTPGFTGIQDYMPDLGDPVARVDDGDIIPTGTLRYTVLTLPAAGTLLDIEDDPISAGQQLLTPVVKYVADGGTGTFSATFQAENTALLDTVATVNFDVVVVGTCEDNEAFCDDGRS